MDRQTDKLHTDGQGNRQTNKDRQTIRHE